MNIFPTLDKSSADIPGFLRFSDKQTNLEVFLVF